MSTDYSFLFPTKLSPNATLLYATRFAGVTLAAPDRWAAHSVWRPFTGTDTLTGFSIADLAALPLGVRPIGGVGTNNGGFIIYGISHLADFDPTPDTSDPDFTAYTQGEWDSFYGADISAKTFRGISTNAVALNLKNTGNAGEFNAQQWVHFYRDLTLTDIQDLDEYCIELLMSYPDLATKLTTTYKYFTNIDIKTGLAGDHRFTFGVKMASGQYEDNGMTGSPSNGTLVWYTQSDSRGSTEISPNEFYYRYINNTVSVPAVDELFMLRFYVKRASSFADHSGRVRIEIVKAGGTQAVLFDCTEGFAEAWNVAHPASGDDGFAEIPASNVTMGKLNRKTERIYIGNYFGGLGHQNITTNIGAINIWDGYPGVLPDPAV